MNFRRDKFLTSGIFDKTLVISLSSRWFMESEILELGNYKTLTFLLLLPNTALF